MAVRLFLAVGLLAGQAPVCKVAAARSFARTHAAPPPAAPACKKGCCAAPRPPAPTTPARDHQSPAEPRCPTDCLSPLCSPVPVLSEPTAAVVHFAGVAENVAAVATPVPSDAHPVPLDRPPRG